MQTIRSPAVVGLFYPGSALTLTHDVRAMLAAARLHARYPLPNPLPQAGEGANDSLREFHVKALIVPHAGYVYSGAVAATAYATLLPIAPRIRRVVLLGPTHRVAVRGLALPGTDAFATPLGTVQVDSEAAQAIAHLPQVMVNREAHALEHALEVQLPFLQTLLPNFTLLPLAVGMATPAEVAEVLELLWGGEETLVVISSDLSHFHPYDEAKQIDAATAQAILDLRQPLSHEQACGGTPINGLILAARRHHLTPHLLDLRNSGDTAGPRDQVVGYASFAFTEEASHGH